MDWLIYYDSLSRVSRDPTEIYGYKLFSVPYLILPDKTKRESHYHNSTEDFDTDWLISSKRKRITVCHSSHTTYSSASRSILRRNIFLPNIRHPFILNLNSAKCPSQNSTDICKTYTYIYGKDPTVQNLPYTRELTFLNILFKNIYYTSVQFDLKELEKKIGKTFDPLFTHPYYQAVIKVKEQEFDSNPTKIIEATNVLVVQSTMTSTDFLNKSTAHIEERATNLGVTKFSTVNNSNSNIINKNISTKNTSLSNYSSAQKNFILTPSQRKFCPPGETSMWSKSSSCARIYD